VTARAEPPAGGRLGIGFLGTPGPRELGAIGVAAEAAGFESAWVAETRLTRDAVSGVTALLLATRRLRVGSAAINVYTRTAGLVAVTFATLAEAAPGRVVLGVGTGSHEPLVAQGVAIDRSRARLRELVRAVRAAWTAPAPVDLDGEFSPLRAARFEVRPDPPPPIYVCGMAERTLDLAAQLADGVVLDLLMPVEVVGAACRRLAGRPVPFAGERAGLVAVSVGDDVDAAAARLRPVVARYLVAFPEIAARAGVDVELVDHLRALVARGEAERAAAAVPTSLVCRLAACGPPASIAARVDELRAVGLDLPILAPEPASIAAVAGGRALPTTTRKETACSSARA
jgi:alkanesulfonate monooxygenase SsuD/methylene tetrahydromethanopterin reductase-like flavin-dependent oxidoreductase (luciferase family)